MTEEGDEDEAEDMSVLLKQVDLQVAELQALEGLIEVYAGIVPVSSPNYGSWKQGYEDALALFLQRVAAREVMIAGGEEIVTASSPTTVVLRVGEAFMRFFPHSGQTKE